MKTVYQSAVLIVLACLIGQLGRAERLSDKTLVEIRFDQKLNQQIPTALQFTDDHGAIVTLEQCLHGRPAVLVLGYYQCPMLCSLVLNGLVECLEDLKSMPGKQFEIIFVSIDPQETPALAASKKENYLKRYGRPGAEGGWHFLTGAQSQIQSLEDAVGFRSAYDSDIKQYAHPSGFVVLTPEGKISRYFFGVSYSPVELSAALHGASDNKIGSPVQQFLLLCFHYNPITSKYGGVIMFTVRCCGVALMVALAFAITRMVRREGRRRASSQMMKTGASP